MQNNTRLLVSAMLAVLAFAAMPRTTALAAYAVKVWNLEERACEIVSSFAPKGPNGKKAPDLLDFVRIFLENLKKETSTNKDIQHVMTVKKLEKDDRNLFGIIETGEYGLESDIVNVNTKALAHHRKIMEADM